MGRIVIVGDVHGCRWELERLLDHIAVGAGDRLYFVGDLVGRGPDAVGVMKLVLKLGATCVRGNHEDKLISYRTATERGIRPTPLNRRLDATVKEMSNGLWKWLMALPLWVDVPDAGIRIVHAGLMPGMPAETTRPRVLMSIRGLTPTGEPTDLRDTDLWGSHYEGPPHVVFGHNAQVDPQLHTWATGIDTGCVYGGKLTAMVLTGTDVPPVEARPDVLVSVPARRMYCPIKGPANAA